MATVSPWGSSPLARGTLGKRHNSRQINGLIPARAGNTFGANQVAQKSGGSSPLARGTRGDYEAQASRGGLIPARAGNTSEHSKPRYDLWAHPRSRGEHSVMSTAWTLWMGSSPLARGTRDGQRNTPSFVGLIPARAGNTNAVIAGSLVDRAHPRSRGEHTC